MKARNVTLIACALFSICLPASAREDPKTIVGGYESKPFYRSYSVSLGFNSASGYYHFCGGALIHKRWVLTAGHCLIDMENVTVRVGLHELDSKQGQFIKPEAWFLHPEYAGTGGNDIALIRLAENAAPQNFQLNFRIESAKTAVVSGWGVLDERSFETSNELREVSLKVTHCALFGKKDGEDYTSLPDTMLCAEYGWGKDACYGDSGGPLVAGSGPTRWSRGTWWSLGIVSWGHGCARPGHPGVYTRTSSFKKWIKDTMKANKAN